MSSMPQNASWCRKVLPPTPLRLFAATGCRCRNCIHDLARSLTRSAPSMHAGTHTVAHVASRAHGLRLALVCSRCAGRTSSASGIAQASFKHSYLWVHACMHGRASVVICTVWCVWICGARLDGRMREGGKLGRACSAVRAVRAVQCRAVQCSRH